MHGRMPCAAMSGLHAKSLLRAGMSCRYEEWFLGGMVGKRPRCAVAASTDQSAEAW